MENQQTEKPKYSITVTGLMDFCESPAHYESFHILKEREPSDAMLEGSAFHLAVLEPEKFDEMVYTKMDPPKGCHIVNTVDELKAYITMKGGKPKGKKSELIELFKKCRDEFALLPEEIESKYEGKIKLTDKKYEGMIKGRNKVLSHPTIIKFQDQGLGHEKEKKLEGEIEGVHIRGKLDWWFYQQRMDRLIVNDLKRSQSAKSHKWQRTVFDRLYFIQAWVYCELIRQNFQKETLYNYIVSESALPHICEVYAADDAQLDAGERMSRFFLNRFKKCTDANYWPGYSDGTIQPCGMTEFQMQTVLDMTEADDV
jgi:hypothetical protein